LDRRRHPKFPSLLTFSAEDGAVDGLALERVPLADEEPLRSADIFDLVVEGCCSSAGDDEDVNGERAGRLAGGRGCSGGQAGSSQAAGTVGEDWWVPLVQDSLEAI
jgi:hypothetical protein